MSGTTGQLAEWHINGDGFVGFPEETARASESVASTDEKESIFKCGQNKKGTQAIRFLVVAFARDLFVYPRWKKKMLSFTRIDSDGGGGGQLIIVSRNTVFGWVYGTQ